MNKYQISNRNFGVEIEFQKIPGVTQLQIFRLLEEQGFQTRSAGYEHTQGQTSKRTLKLDGSLGASGLELVSPILHGQEGVEAVRNVVNPLTQVGYVDSRCGLHVHHEVEKTPDRIQKRTIRNVCRVYKSAQDAINELIVHEIRIGNTYCRTLPEVQKVSSIQLRRLSRYHVVNFEAANVFGTIEFRQYQGCLNADQVQSLILLTHAIVEYATQAQAACQQGVKKIENRFENRLFVTGEELKKMRLLLKRGC